MRRGSNLDQGHRSGSTFALSLRKSRVRRLRKAELSSASAQDHGARLVRLAVEAVTAVRRRTGRSDSVVGDDDIDTGVAARSVGVGAHLVCRVGQLLRLVLRLVRDDDLEHDGQTEALPRFADGDAGAHGGVAEVLLRLARDGLQGGEEAGGIAGGEQFSGLAPLPLPPISFGMARSSETRPSAV